MYAAIGDQHVPFHDRRLWRLFLSWANEVRPNGIVITGDFADCFQLSKYLQDPMHPTRFRQDAKLCFKMLRQLKDIKNHPQIFYIEGNHEARYRKYIWKNAPALWGIESVDIQHVLGLDDLGISYHESHLQVGDVYVSHGDLARKCTGASAKGMFEKHGVKLLHGHSHRCGDFYVRTRRGLLFGKENMCMCKLDLGYLDFPNWQHGWSLLHSITSRRVDVQQLVIDDYKFAFDKHIWKG